MVRTLDIFLVAALVAGAGWTFKVKHDAERAVARVEVLETRIRLEREAIDILKADWSLLTSPDRLENLLERHKGELGLEPVAPRQIVTFDQVPQRLPQQLVPLDGSGDPQSDSAQSQTDASSITGSVETPESGEKPEEIE